MLVFTLFCFYFFSSLSSQFTYIVKYFVFFEKTQNRSGTIIQQLISYPWCCLFTQSANETENRSLNVWIGCCLWSKSENKQKKMRYETQRDTVRARVWWLIFSLSSVLMQFKLRRARSTIARRINSNQIECTKDILQKSRLTSIDESSPLHHRPLHNLFE